MITYANVYANHVDFDSLRDGFCLSISILKIDLLFWFMVSVGRYWLVLELRLG